MECSWVGISVKIILFLVLLSIEASEATSGSRVRVLHLQQTPGPLDGSIYATIDKTRQESSRVNGGLHNGPLTQSADSGISSTSGEEENFLDGKIWPFVEVCHNFYVSFFFLSCLSSFFEKQLMKPTCTGIHSTSTCMRCIKKSRWQLLPLPFILVSHIACVLKLQSFIHS